MATDTLRPSSDISNAGIAWSTGTTTWSLIDDDPDSGSNADYIYNTTTLGDDVAWVNLAAVTGFTNFAAMTAATVRVRYETTGWSNDTWRWSVQVFKADQTTALTGVGAVELGTNVTPTNVDAATINAAGQAATAAEWANARLRIGVGVTNRNMGADSGAQVRIHAVEVNVTYDQLTAKTDVPFRRSSASRARTVTAVLQGDQWGKFIVPQVPWINPVRRGYAVVPAAQGNGAAWSPDGRFLAMAHQTTPRVSIYGRSGSTFTELADPATLPTGDGTDLAWSPDGRFLAVTHAITPYISIYERSGSTFTKLADPASLPSSTSYSPSWSPDGRFLALSALLTPYIVIYERSGTTFTRLANPGTLPASSAYGTAFSPDGRFLAVAHTTTPFLTIYERSGTTFTKLTDPATLPAGNGNDCAFSPDGRFLAVVHDTTPFVTIYERSGTTFTKLADPATLPAGNGNDCAFSPDGRLLAIAHSTSPFVTIYQRSGTTFSKLANPATLPTGTPQSTAWSPDGRFLAVAHATTPFATIYETSGLNPTEGLLWMPNPGER